MQLGDGARGIILVGIGVIVIVTKGVHSTAGLIAFAVSLLVVALLLELTFPRSAPETTITLRSSPQH
jgi:hypothetical protein